MVEFGPLLGSVLPNVKSRELAQRLVRIIAELAPFDSWRIVRFSNDLGPELVAGLDSDHCINDYLDRYYLEDPFYLSMNELRVSELVSISDIAPRNFRNTNYFINYLDSGGEFADQYGFVYRVGRGQGSMLTFGRTSKYSKFRDCEIARIREVTPLVLSALMLIWVNHWSENSQQQNNIDNDILLKAGSTLLSRRQNEIYALLLEGHSAKSIAQILDITPGTVQCHTKNIYRRLGVSSRGELFRDAVKQLKTRNLYDPTQYC